MLVSEGCFTTYLKPRKLELLKCLERIASHNYFITSKDFACMFKFRLNDLATTICYM